MQLTPSQSIALDMINKKIEFLGSRINIFLLGKNGVGKSFLGRYLISKQKFSYVNLNEKGLEDYIITENGTSLLKIKDLAIDIIRPLMTKAKNLGSEGLILDGIDPILIIYSEKSIIKSSIYRIMRTDFELPLIMISSLTRFFNFEKKYDNLEQDKIDISDDNYVLIKFTSEDSKFFTKSILGIMPQSSGENFTGILIQHNKEIRKNGKIK